MHLKCNMGIVMHCVLALNMVTVAVFGKLCAMLSGRDHI